MENKHTPGPWHNRPNRPLKKGSLERYETISDNGLCVALPIGGLNNREEGLANARLIAAAPALLAACKSAQSQIIGMAEWLRSASQLRVAKGAEGILDQLATVIEESQNEKL